MGIGQRLVEAFFAGILRDGDQRRHAATLLVLATHQATRALRRDQHHVQVLARLDLLEVDVEAVREQQRRTLRNGILDLGVQRLLRGVRHQDGDQLRALHGVDRRQHGQAVALGLVPAVALAHADHHVETAVLQVQRMGAALAAIAQDRDARAAQGGFVDILRSI